MVYSIRGGEPLRGEVELSGSKNSAVYLLSASLLSGQESVFFGLPAVGDVRAVLSLLISCGAQIKEEKEALRIKTTQVSKVDLTDEPFSSFSGSLALAGPLLGRMGRVVVGEVNSVFLGRRPVDRHLALFKSFGAEILPEGKTFLIQARKLHPSQFAFPKTTVLGTVNGLALGALVDGESFLTNCALEPEVSDLVVFLTQMGAQVKLTSSREARIYGTAGLSGAQMPVPADRHEAVFFILAALLSGGDVTIKNPPLDRLLPILALVSRVGAQYEVVGEKLRVWRHHPLTDQPLTLETAPFPGLSSNYFPSLALLLALGGGGLIKEGVFKRRLSTLESLSPFGLVFENLTPSEAEMPWGAQEAGFEWKRKGQPKIVAKIAGRQTPKPSQVHLKDPYSGSAALLASLLVEGESRLSGGEILSLAFENLTDKLRLLGARIE